MPAVGIAACAFRHGYRPLSHNANAVIDPATSASLEYEQLRFGPDAAAWMLATANEIGRLIQGNLPHTTSGQTLCTLSATRPCQQAATPPTRAKIPPKPLHSWLFIQFAGDVSTPTADITNSVLSTPDEPFTTIDIKDYLNTPMEKCEYMRILVKSFPTASFSNTSSYTSSTMATSSLKSAKAALESLYTEWSGNCYLVLNLGWGYTTCTVNMSTPG